MTLGRAQAQQYLFDDINAFCDATLAPYSIYTLLHREREQLFPDELFADLYVAHGRRSVPPSVVATVMVLQRLGGYSDREAVEHYTFDARWRYAAGVGGYDGGGRQRFVHTVLVEMRESFPGRKDGARSGRTGSSRSRWVRRARRGWWAGTACWTRRRCTTR